MGFEEDEAGKDFLGQDRSRLFAGGWWSEEEAGPRPSSGGYHRQMEGCHGCFDARRRTRWVDIRRERLSQEVMWEERRGGEEEERRRRKGWMDGGSQEERRAPDLW